MLSVEDAFDRIFSKKDDVETSFLMFIPSQME